RTTTLSPTRSRSSHVSSMASRTHRSKSRVRLEDQAAVAAHRDEAADEGHRRDSGCRQLRDLDLLHAQTTHRAFVDSGRISLIHTSQYLCSHACVSWGARPNV